jgi:hypothetical protein
MEIFPELSRLESSRVDSGSRGGIKSFSFRTKLLFLLLFGRPDDGLEPTRSRRDFAEKTQLAGRRRGSQRFCVGLRASFHSVFSLIREIKNRKIASPDNRVNRSQSCRALPALSARRVNIARHTRAIWSGGEQTETTFDELLSRARKPTSCT